MTQQAKMGYSCLNVSVQRLLQCYFNCYQFYFILIIVFDQKDIVQRTLVLPLLDQPKVKSRLMLKLFCIYWFIGSYLRCYLTGCKLTKLN